jgi:hypothetical protein
MKKGAAMQDVMQSFVRLIEKAHRDERGLNTAELMGNAALAIGALVVIWAALEVLGVDVVHWIRGQLLGG